MILINDQFVTHQLLISILCIPCNNKNHSGLHKNALSMEMKEKAANFSAAISFHSNKQPYCFGIGVTRI